MTVSSSDESPSKRRLATGSSIKEKRKHQTEWKAFNTQLISPATPSKKSEQKPDVTFQTAVPRNLLEHQAAWRNL